MDQLMNMCYSNNLGKLLKQPERQNQFLIDDYVKSVHELNKENETDGSEKSNYVGEVDHALHDWGAEPDNEETIRQFDAQFSENLEKLAGVKQEQVNPETPVGLDERTRQDDLLKQQGELLKTHGEILKMRESSNTTPQSSLAEPVNDNSKMSSENVEPLMNQPDVPVQPFVEPVFQDPELKQAYDTLPQDMRDKIRIKNFSQEKIEKLLNQIRQINPPSAAKFEPVPEEDSTKILKVEESKEEKPDEPSSSSEQEKKEEVSPTVGGGGEKKTITFNV